MNESQLSLGTIDYIIIAIYFAGIIAHGVYVSRKLKSGADSYFLAGRQLPWYLIGFSLYASNMSGSSFVGLMGGSYENGISIFNYEWTASLVLVFFAIFILPSYLRAKISTVPEYLEYRYDLRSRRAFSIFTILAIMFIDTAGALYAGGLVIANAIPFLELWSAVAILAFIAGLYTIFGGLAAVVVTDTVQAILLMCGAVIIFAVGLYEIGGWDQIFKDIPDRHQHLILPADDKFLPWPGIWGVVLLGFYYWTINQFVVQRTLGAGNIREGRQGAVFAGFLKIPSLFLMILPGVIALQLYPDLKTPDLAFPTLALDLMPVGVRGIIMAALIAAIMSSLDSALNSAGTLVTMDFIKPWKTGWSEQRLVVIGRIVTGIAMVIGAIYAPIIAGFESLFSYFQSSLSYVVPPIVVVYVLGIFWPRLNGSGAFWTIISGLIVGIPLFLAKEVFSWWTDAGLPEVHYTIMSSAMMALGMIVHIGCSYATSRPAGKEMQKLVWDREDYARDFATMYSPWYMDYKFLAALLIAFCAGFIIWFW